jgi:hypothetical protein
MVCRATEYRAVEDGDEKYIEGYFAVFNSDYEICDGITESIQPGAFTDCLAGDIRALTNHDTTLVLGRTKAGTLELKEDSRGLWGRVKINPQDGDAMNLYSRVQRGDVDQCSFGFEIGSQRVDIKEDGSAHWTIERVEPLYEVTVATFPAYQDTSVAARTADTAAAKKRTLDTWKQTMKNKLKGD